jgi:hypothetical protein
LAKADQKFGPFEKVFRNFVPNFREWVANSNNYKLKTQQIKEIKNMKNQTTLFTATVLALAFALAPGAEANPRPDGGPTQLWSTARANASSEGGAQSGMPENILPIATIRLAPVGLTIGQTARLNLVNINVANGITVSCSFIDASGNTLAQSVTTLSLNEITSFDFQRGDAPGEPPQQLRAEVRVQLDIFTDGVSSDSLHRSLEVFDNSSGTTIVYIGGGGS